MDFINTLPMILSIHDLGLYKWILAIPFPRNLSIPNLGLYKWILAIPYPRNLSIPNPGPRITKTPRLNLSIDFSGCKKKRFKLIKII